MLERFYLPHRVLFEIQYNTLGEGVTAVTAMTRGENRWRIGKEKGSWSAVVLMAMVCIHFDRKSSSRTSAASSLQFARAVQLLSLNLPRPGHPRPEVRVWREDGGGTSRGWLLRLDALSSVVRAVAS